MSLVDYPDSDEEDKPIIENIKKRKLNLPPLPKEFIIQEKKEEENKEEEKNHNGRIRSFPHIEGNYPSHIYLSVKSNAKLNQIVSNIIQKVEEKEELKIFPLIDEEKEGEEEEKEFHVSLSRPFALRRYQIEECNQLLRQSIGVFLRTKMKNPKFSLSLHSSDYQWLINDDGTRSFLTLNIDMGSEVIIPLIERVDEILSRFGVEKYYEDPIPHLTIGWTLGDVKSQLKSERYPLKELKIREVEFVSKKVSFKSGKWIFRLDQGN